MREDDFPLKYKLFRIGLCLICCKGRAGRTVLSESFDFWSPSSKAANMSPTREALANVGFIGWAGISSKEY